MSTVFPNEFDTDLEIERVDNNITEIGGDVINSLRDAVFMIERTVGINPQGNKPSLAERIDVSIDDNGRIRSDAIGELGLVSLPIINSHVGTNAGIEESKLDLDFSTQSLKNSINSLATDIGGTQSGIASLSSSLSLHILGQGNFHDGYDIKINSEGEDQIGLAGISGTTIGDALVQIVAFLLSGDPSQGTYPHIDLELPSIVKHRSSEIFVDSAGFNIIDRTVNNVQDALSSVDAKQGAFGARHLDTFHANGILKEINSGELFNSNQKVVDQNEGANYTEGTSIITLPGIDSFDALNVQPGDIIEIVSDVLDQGTYQIRAIGPLLSSETLGDLPSLAANQLALFHVFIESSVEVDGIVVNIYKPASASSQSAPLACAIRNNESIVDTVTILNPDAARIVSVGFNGSILNGDGYSIAVRVGLGDGQYRELTIFNLNRERLNVNQAQPVDANSVAERINALVSNPTDGYHFPISAFKIGNELAIAHNLVGTDFTLEVLDGYTANFALGLDSYGANVVGEVISGNSNNSFVINGVETSSIVTLFDGYASIESDTDTFILWTNDGQIANPLKLGVMAGSVIHITGHETLSANGSYTLLTTTSSTVSTFSVEPIPAPSNPTVFNVKITGADVPLTVLGSTETDKGLAQIFINSNGEVFAHQRLMYGTNLGAAIEIIGVSDTFPISEVNLSVALDGNLALFNIIFDSFAGPTATIHEDFKGIFKVYHSNNLDFLMIKTIPGTISGGFEAVAINTTIPSDEALQLCVFHFNGDLEITNIVDTRLFGNLNSGQIRDDLVEELSQRPIQELRSDGVARGFDVLDIPFVDSITGMQALPVQGGIAYVNGVRVAVETQRVLIQSQDEEGSAVTGPRIVAINEFGSIQAFTDELGEILTDAYNASAAYGKLLPLYQVNMVHGDIIDYVDLRLFINNLDNKLELIVDETNNVVGNFRSLEGALLYASSYPHREHLTIKIINAVFPTRQLNVPSGISIIGDSPWGGDSKHQIINSSNLGESFIILNGNNRLENVEILSEVSAMNGALVTIAGPNVNIEKCLLKFGEDVSSVDSDVGILLSSTATNDVNIINNKIDMVYAGIVSLDGCDELVIEKNVITNLAGTGGISNGIKVGSASIGLSNISISNNTINIPSVVTPTDIRGISIDIGETIDNVRIDGNSIIHGASNAVTNGIRIENEQATGNKITNLFLLNNLIDGIRTDDNDIWGIYITNVSAGKINNNIIANVGIADNIDVGCIGIADDVDFVEISNNILRDCAVSRGIEITGADQVNISNNTLDTLGTGAYYINGSATHSSVCNNTLIGPGLKGIKWTGTNSKINDNNFSQPSDASYYAFEEHAIYIQTSDVDVMNNTITGMIFSEESIGISNVSLARDRIKIIGNTISGSYMAKGIELFSDGHVVSNNRLLNDSNTDAGDSICIELNEVSNSLIMGNVLRGSVGEAISAVTSLDNVTIANNIIDARNLSGSSMNIDIGFALEIAENCFIAGNKILNNGGTVNENLIGSPAETGFSDTGNTIGINPGFKDMRNIPASQAISSVDSASESPTWAIKNSNEWWELFNNDTIIRSLYFPIDDLPNGSKILSVQAQGYWDDGTITIQAFRKGRTDLLTSSISNTDIIAQSPFGRISDGTGVGSGYVDTTVNYGDGEVVDYYNYNYYVLITHTGGSGVPDENQIHGLTVIFRY